ncbi:hypothetical protein GCM10022255_013790 [Dactylosporangium darangshiense]|uniref:Uncharacterized protein n=1 Tax=Dactylosporangium darangshiense TaxID=579108 RepID=A0ABP8D0H9_9ACTN
MCVRALVWQTACVPVWRPLLPEAGRQAVSASDGAGMDAGSVAQLGGARRGPEREPRRHAD